MSKQIFINLPVANLERSIAFYSSLGFEQNMQFSDHTAACMVWSEAIYVMLLTHEKFSSFIEKPIADTKGAVAGLFSLSVDQAQEVGHLMEKGLAAGGVEPTPTRDYGFMLQRTLEDFDGHTWEIFYMDLNKMPKA